MERLDRARMVAGLTIAQLAARAGLNRDTVADMLRGRRQPQVHSLIACCRAALVDPAEVIVESMGCRDQPSGP